ncbi:MAG: LIC20035 family adhesin [Leptospira sp.]|nr:LIC20035 family adhesin [Leptospira sp.]
MNQQRNFRIAIVLLFALYLTQCKSTSEIKEGDPSLPNFEMISANIRVERFPNSKLLRATGPVVTKCGSSTCSASEVRELSENKIKDFPRDGEWKVYAQTQEAGETLRDRVFVNYLDMIGRYQDDKRVGIWKAYHRDTNIVSAEIPYENDKRNGIVKSYDQSGKLSGETPWVMDERNGIAKTYTPSGDILSQTNWRNDKRNGSYFRKIMMKGSANMMEEGDFVNDKRHGEWKFYHTNSGLLRQKAIYTNGELNGAETNYHADGKTVLSEGMNRGDARVGQWKIYYDDGKIRGEGGYVPIPESQRAEGDPKFKQFGVWKEYYKNGQIFATGPRDRTRVGNWTFHYNNGQMRFRGKMMNEVMMERSEIFNREGLKIGEGKLFFSLVSIDESKDDIKDSYRPEIPFTYYHPNGKKRLEIMSATKAVEYDTNGQEIGRGEADSQGRKQGCWKEKGGTMFYMLGNPRPTMTANACK